MDEKRTEELTAAYLDGMISDAERDELAAALMSSRDELDALAGELEIHRLLEFRAGNTGEANKKAASRILHFLRVSGDGKRFLSEMKERKRAQDIRAVRLWLPLAAAGIAAAIAAGWFMGNGLWFMGEGDGHNKAQKVGVVARVAAVGGMVDGEWVMVDGKRKALKVGDEVRAGDRVVTGEGGRVRLAYVGGASVELESNAECGMRNAELLELRKGRLTAEVAKQSEIRDPQSAPQWRGLRSASTISRPFVVATPHARVEVLGTRFSVRVEGERGKIIDGPRHSTGFNKMIRGEEGAATWLNVDEGVVRFTRLADSSFAKASSVALRAMEDKTEDKGKSIEVAAGQFAVAGESAESFALNVYPTGTEYVDGPALFEDDFENGLGKWMVTSIDPNTPEKALYRADGNFPYVSIRKVRRNGRESNVAAIDRANLPVDARKITFSLLGAIPREGSFVFEWDFHYRPFKGGRYAVGKGMRPVESDRWRRMRWECVAEDGMMAITWLADGKMIGRERQKRPGRDWSLVVRSDMKAIMIDNFVARKLVAVRGGM